MTGEELEEMIVQRARLWSGRRPRAGTHREATVPEEETVSWMDRLQVIRHETKGGQTNI